MQTEEETNQSVLEAYGKLPLVFIPNVGQEDQRISYYAQGKNFRFAFTTDQVRMSFFEVGPLASGPRNTGIIQGNLPEQAAQGKESRIKGINLIWRFLNAHSDMSVEGAAQETGKINYLRGGDPQNHYTNLPIYREVAYRQVWPGIDVVFQGKQGMFKYDVLLQPGGLVDDIRIGFEGADGIRVDDIGNLLIDTPFGTLTDVSPVAYQEIDDKRLSIDCRFVIRSEADGSQNIGFEMLEEVDHHYPLVIDPILLYSTYLGGSAFDSGNGIAVDASGNAYVTGFTQSSDFPTTPGAFDISLTGSQDAFVTKLNADGTALVYSTYLGGSDTDTGDAIAVDAFGNAYVTGSTQSSDFPTTLGAYDTTLGGVVDAFVTKLNATGTALLYSTYLGGSGLDRGGGITVDASGNAYVTGFTQSNDFPTTPGAFQTIMNGTEDAFVTKLNAAGTALVFSTFLGGGGSDTGNAIAVDAAGNVYVAGDTGSADFPTTLGAYDTTFNGISDVFITKMNAAGTALIYSTYIGGSITDQSSGIAIDASGNAYVTGFTQSSDYPTTPGAFDTVFNASGSFDGFVTKLNPTGTALVYSTFLGGENDDFGVGIAVDAFGNAFVTGRTDSTDFPTTPGAFDTSLNGIQDAFITRFSLTGSNVLFSSYLGGGGIDVALGIALDPFANAYVTGQTTSSDFPTTPGAFDTSIGGVFQDAFVAKIGEVVILGPPGPQGPAGPAAPRIRKKRKKRIKKKRCIRNKRKQCLRKKKKICVKKKQNSRKKLSVINLINL